jgi:hypothetical protein
VAFDATFGPGFYWFAAYCVVSLAVQQWDSKDGKEQLTGHRSKVRGKLTTLLSEGLMRFSITCSRFAAVTMGIVGVAASDQAAQSAEVPTFTKDVAPDPVQELHDVPPAG